MPEPKNTNTSDGIQACLDRLHAGDGEARRELLSVAMNRLQRLARKIMADIPHVKRWEDTDDVLQNSSIRLWKALEGHRPPTPLDFFRLAACLIRRELVDMSRSLFGPLGIGANHHSTALKDRDNPLGNSAFPVPKDDSSDPGKLSEWTEFHEYVDALPEEEKILFDLLWYQGLTMADTSMLTGIPLRTLGRKWQLARVKLYKALLERGE